MFILVGLRLFLLNEAGWGFYMVVWGCLRCERLWQFIWGWVEFDEIGWGWLRFDEVGLRFVLLDEAGWGLYMVVWGCLRCDRLWQVIWGWVGFDEIGWGLMKLVKFWIGWLRLCEVNLKFATQVKSICNILGFAKWVWTNLTPIELTILIVSFSFKKGK